MMTLLELQGLIANMAIENPEHSVPYQKVTKLIEKFGPFRTVDWKEVREVLYGR